MTTEVQDRSAPTPPATSSATGIYQPGLDGMKGFGMFLILAYHSDQGWAKGAFLGLSQFFTLSGFLITSMLIRAHHRGGIDLVTFWSRRLRRLMPAALAALAGVVVFGATVADRDQAQDLPLQVLAAATYWSNILFIVTETSYEGLFASPSPVQHFWSLSLEEQFYVFMPIGMLLLLRRTRSTAVLAGIFAAAALASTAWMAYLYDSGAGLDRVYYGTDTRVAEMLVGGLLALALFHVGTDFAERTRRVIAAVATVAFALSMWAIFTIPLADGPVWRGGMLAYSLISVALLLGVLVGRGPVAWLYSLRPFPAVGRITYGLYLYHWPLFLWLTAERTGLSVLPLFGLRMALTFAAAGLSYRYLEMPIRDGSMFGICGRAKVLVAPGLVVAIVAACFITVDRDAPDPLATLRDTDRSLTPPVAAADGVLDLLVITDETDPGVISRIEELGTTKDDLSVVRAEPFGCSAVEEVDGATACADWVTAWPALIEEHDPDLVLFYVEEWPDAELARLSGLGPDDLTGFAQKVLADGFDRLSANGARILFAAPGASFPVDFARSVRPFHVAMGVLESQRTDLRHVLGGRLPEGDVVPREEFVEDSASALLTDAALYQRTEDRSGTRVMIVGDSQARSLGYGLERWGAQEGDVLVWNVATEGCGIANDGTVGTGAQASPVSGECAEAVAAFPGQVAEFDPDIVIVLTSLWDLEPRRIEGWPSFLEPGDADFDEYLVEEFARAVDTFSAGGAQVVWALAPCIEVKTAPGQTDTVGAYNDEKIRHLDDVILPELAEERPDTVTLFDLDEILCPGGRYATEIDGISPIRTDGVHFSVDGSLWFAVTHGPELIRLGGG